MHTTTRASDVITTMPTGNRFATSTFDRLRPYEFEELVQRYLDGEEATALATTYGVSPHTVENWFKRGGVPVRPRQLRSENLTQDQIEKILAEYDLGVANRPDAITKRWGISRTTLHYHVRQRGNGHQGE